MTTSLVISLAVLAIVIGVQYRPAAAVTLQFARRLAPTLPLTAHHSTAAVVSLLSVGGSGLSGIALYVAASVALGRSPLQAALGPAQALPLLPLGVLLGLAEAALALLLATALLQLTLPFRLARVGREAFLDLLVMGRAGWIRAYLLVLRMLPLPLAIGVILLPLAAEELLFRALAVGLLRPLGLLAAISISLLPFLAVQRVGMASWFTSLPAMVGAVVVGLVHGYLYWYIPSVAPLLVAHISFFLFVAFEP
jgi:CAAX prenyl protease-like protein